MGSFRINCILATARHFFHSSPLPLFSLKWVLELGFGRGESDSSSNHNTNENGLLRSSSTLRQKLERSRSGSAVAEIIHCRPISFSHGKGTIAAPRSQCSQCMRTGLRWAIDLDSSCLNVMVCSMNPAPPQGGRGRKAFLV